MIPDNLEDSDPPLPPTPPGNTLSPLRFELCYPDTPTASRWSLKDWVRSTDDVPGEMMRILKKWERVRVILKQLHDPRFTESTRSQYAGCLGVRLLLNGVTIGLFAPGLPPTAPPPLEIRRDASAQRPVTPIPIKRLSPAPVPISNSSSKARRRPQRGSS